MPYQLTDDDRQEIAALRESDAEDYTGAVYEWLTSEPSESGDAVFRSAVLWPRTLEALDAVFAAWRNRPDAPVAAVGPNQSHSYTVADLVALTADAREFDNAVFYWLMERNRNPETDEVFLDQRVLEATYDALDRIHAVRSAQLAEPPPRFVNDQQWRHRTERTVELARRARKSITRQVGLLRDAKRQQEQSVSPRQMAMRVVADTHPRAFAAARRALAAGDEPAKVKDMLREQFPEQVANS